MEQPDALWMPDIALVGIGFYTGNSSPRGRAICSCASWSEIARAAGLERRAV